MTRWFISYWGVVSDFLSGEVLGRGYKAVITDVSPARWILEVQRKHGGEHNILYAEQISLSLAAELTHGGAGIATDYYTRESRS